MIKGLTTKTSNKPGKTVAIFGGVHGNERVGVDAVRWAVENIEPEFGTIHFVEANQQAITKNIRFIEKNLNRCFLKRDIGTSSEALRAKELMPLLDTCDALLDIHSSTSKEATPFIICENDGFELAQLLDFPIISYGWDAIEPGGTDGYMFNQGKMGMCLECGSVFDAAAQATRAQNSILQFLEYFGVISTSKVTADPTPKKYIHVYKAARKQTDEFSFARDYADFEPLKEGKLFAKDGPEEYLAQKGDCIIFPHPDTAIGNEVFILGKEIPNQS